MVRDGFDGVNIDLEPATDSGREGSRLNPTVKDAMAYASFLEACSQALHRVNKVRKMPSWPRSWANFSLL